MRTEPSASRLCLPTPVTRFPGLELGDAEGRCSCSGDLCGSGGGGGEGWGCRAWVTHPPPPPLHGRARQPLWLHNSGSPQCFPPPLSRGLLNHQPPPLNGGPGHSTNPPTPREAVLTRGGGDLGSRQRRCPTACVTLPHWLDRVPTFGCLVSQPSRLLTIPEPHQGAGEREMPLCLVCMCRAPGRHALQGGKVPPPPSRPPSLCPATVSLTPSASLNGICNRQ